MAITTFKRYENKFLLNPVQYQAVLPTLMRYMCLDEYCMNGQEYTIYNIYYDTDDSSIVRHSLSKPYYKEKLRLRSYIIPTAPNHSVYLELKKKIGGIVTKRRAVLTLSQANQFLASGIRPVQRDYITAQVLNEIAYFQKNHAVEPAAYISYRRNALFGRNDRDFRVTFDHSIITRREDLRIEAGCYGENLLPGQILMEVKGSTAFPMWLAKLLSENQIYRTSFSKYGKEYTQNHIKTHAHHNLLRAV